MNDAYERVKGSDDRMNMEKIAAELGINPRTLSSMSRIV
jgi:phage terminase small subunit